MIAGRILAEVGDVARFATKDTFASYNGTAPTGASSGDQVRHRLSRAGNRRNGHALHMMAVTQIRCPTTPGRLYYERKRAEGKTPEEALRCLKRRLPGLACRQLPADRHGTIEECGSPTAPRPTRPASTSPASRSHRAAPRSRPACHPAPAGSSRWTGKTAGSPASKSPAPAPGSTTTSSTKPRSSADPGPPRPPARAAPPSTGRQPMVDIPARRCRYATEPGARPDCQVTAVVRRGRVALCASRDALRSTLGKGQAAAQLPAAPPIDPLHWVTQAQAQLRAAEAELAATVIRARQAGQSWTAIGASLGTTRQAAQQRFGHAT